MAGTEEGRGLAGTEEGRGVSGREGKEMSQEMSQEMSLARITPHGYGRPAPLS